MCARYDLKTDPLSLQLRFELSSAEVYMPKPGDYFPTERLPVVMGGAHHELAIARWGLIPSWAKDLNSDRKMINARCETVLESRVFARPLARKRCLVPMTSFYEWRTTESGRKARNRYTVPNAPNGLFSAAGLYDVWSGGDEPIVTFTILTTSANGLVSAIHDRMPVLLTQEDEAIWLDTEHVSGAEAAAMCKPFDARLMEMQELHVDRSSSELSFEL